MDQGPQPARKVDSNVPLTRAEWEARRTSRERRKLIGLLVIALFILALAFFRFGKTIPWGAR